VFAAADQAIASFMIIAIKAVGSPFAGHKPDDLALEGGRVERVTPYAIIARTK
jgi:hypothetical protein